MSKAEELAGELREALGNILELHETRQDLARVNPAKYDPWPRGETIERLFGEIVSTLGITWEQVDHADLTTIYGQRTEIGDALAALLTVAGKEKP